MRLACFLLLLAMFVAGCRSKSESVRGVPLEQQLVPPPSQPPGQGGAEGAENLGEVPLPQEQAATRTVEPEAEKPERDLSEELKLAVGSPASCLSDFRASQPATLSLYLTATVRPTGMIIQPTASGAGISAAAAKCIEGLAGAVRLRPLDTQQSERVSTTLLVNVEPVDLVVEEKPAEPVAARDVVQPEPKKPTIPPSGEPIGGPRGQPIDGPQGTPIAGPTGIPIDGPQGVPID